MMIYAKFPVPADVHAKLKDRLRQLQGEWGTHIIMSAVIRELIMTHPALSKVDDRPMKTSSSALPATYAEYSEDHWLGLRQKSDGALNIAFTVAQEDGVEALLNFGGHEDIPAAFKRWEAAGRPTSKAALSHI